MPGMHAATCDRVVLVSRATWKVKTVEESDSLREDTPQNQVE